MKSENRSFKLSSLFNGAIVGFFVVFLVHLIFKSLFLANYGFWYGEVFNLFYSGQDWGLIKHTSEWNRNAPLYYYFLAIWKSLFGVSEFAIRFSSVFFSSLAAGLLYLLTRKHFGRTAAIISILLFTFCGDIYSYSQETSCQSIVLFLTVLSFYLFFYLQSKKNLTVALLLGVCNFLLVYTQYNTVIIPVLQILLTLIFYNKQVFRSVGISFLTASLLIFWRMTIKTMNRIFSSEHLFRTKWPSFSDARNIFYDFFNGEILFWIFTIIVLIAVTYQLFTKSFKLNGREEKIKMASILFGGIGTVFDCCGLYFLMPEFSKGFILFAAPFLFVTVGVLVSKVAKEIRYAIVGATILFSLGSYTRMYLNSPRPMNYKSAVKMVKKLRNSKTVTLVETHDVGILFAYYFDKDIFSDYKNYESKLNEKGIYLVSTAEDVEAIDLSKYDRVILTQTFQELNVNDKKLIKYIFSKYKFNTSTKQYADVIVSLFGREKQK